MNCRVAQAAFDPSSSAEEIDTINRENLRCGVKLEDRPFAHVTASPPAAHDAERAWQEARSLSGG